MLFCAETNDEPRLASNHVSYVHLLVDHLTTTSNSTGSHNFYFLAFLQVRHVFCVKPNNELSSSSLDGKVVLRQLSTAGVAAAAQAQVRSLPAGRRVDKRAFFREFSVVPGAIQRYNSISNPLAGRTPGNFSYFSSNEFNFPSSPTFLQELSYVSKPFHVD